MSLTLNNTIIKCDIPTTHTIAVGPLRMLVVGARDGQLPDILHGHHEMSRRLKKYNGVRVSYVQEALSIHVDNLVSNLTTDVKLTDYLSNKL